MPSLDSMTVSEVNKGYDKIKGNYDKANNMVENSPNAKSYFNPDKKDDSEAKKRKKRRLRK